MSKLIGAGILAIDKQTGRILMVLRNFNAYNTIDGNCFAPAGGTFKDSDKTPRNTAIREFIEETGCRETFLLSNMPIYKNENNHITFYTYLGLFDRQFQVIINSENRDYEWFDIDHLPENLLIGVQELIRDKKNDIKQFISLHCDLPL